MKTRHHILILIYQKKSMISIETMIFLISKRRKTGMKRGIQKSFSDCNYAF